MYVLVKFLELQHFFKVVLCIRIMHVTATTLFSYPRLNCPQLMSLVSITK